MSNSNPQSTTPSKELDKILVDFYRMARDDEVIPYSQETKDEAKAKITKLITQARLSSAQELYEYVEHRLDADGVSQLQAMQYMEDYIDFLKSPQSSGLQGED